MQFIQLAGKFSLLYIIHNDVVSFRLLLDGFLISVINFSSCICEEYEFCALCLRCSCLPVMVHWLNQVKASPASAPSSVLGNFKQACGLLCEVITLFMTNAAKLDSGELITIFRRVTLLYVQCAIENNESLVRIGNSCFR